MSRIGIYSGSFNPIHVGHLALANWICEFTEIDEVWFLVSPHNPFKSEQELLDQDFRLELTRIAIGNYPKFKASDYEFHLPKPSYTINTLTGLKKDYPQHQFHLLIGADNWLNFPRWKNQQQIIDQFSIIIYPRLGIDVSIDPQYLNVCQVAAPVIEISSQFIRSGLRANKDIRFFLPELIHPYVDEIKKRIVVDL